ncbi:MAG: hypothetical protein WCD57_19585 [Acidobacteriaceae bacterium]
MVIPRARYGFLLQFGEPDFPGYTFPMPKSTFEAEFKAFVEYFGGEVVPEEATARSADYVFRKYNVVAELKCLVVDQTPETKRKLSEKTSGAAVVSHHRETGWPV